MSPIATSSSSSSNSSSDTAPNGNDSSNTSVATDSTEVIKPVIAIIGAGVSGLKAAQVLLDKGYEVVIYEARDRAGGRTCTSDRLGKEVDLGPNWIHGTSNNPIVPLSQLSESQLHQYSDICPIFTPGGDVMDQAEADELQDLLWRVIERAVEYSKGCYAAIPADKSFYDYCVEKAEELFGSSPDTVREQEGAGTAEGGGKGGVKRGGHEHVRWKGQEERRKEIWLAMAEMWGTFIGSSVKRQSLKFFFLEEPLEGPNLFVASTYKLMIQTLLKPVLDANILKLDTPIDEITTITEDGRKRVFLSSLRKPQENRLVDGVIVTTPLGCLKRDMIKFQPPLPQRIKDSISSLSYGNLEKVYIKFPRAFWGSDGPDFFTFLAPTYAPTTNPGHWHMCCFSLAHLPGDCAQPTLLFYVFGPISAHLTGTLPPATTPEGRSQYLSFFAPYFSKLPNYTPTSADCTPTDLVATEWSRDRWAGYGSYSNFQVGLTAGGDDIEALRDGVPEQRLWFGGEHTAPILGLGSVSGAYWSGEDAAEKVGAAFGAVVTARGDDDARNGCRSGVQKSGRTNWYGKTVHDGPTAAAVAAAAGQLAV
ncbi:uncharacterized protein H6S33_011615 [Morchella sextelata]|uniref:uncharacterized protein n=1 Tax=Morchella sextelata TaxID=1174677 RepID=UPI001D03B902|nr:uncharacterized protein H6S33_011615 [Morchella sextelata]KAH0611188.1 hypothetical protein H6S33_011615 [Morchella sextelata]